ncbi:MAG: MerR family transcriptional regulator [Anaerolineales bacterium]|nr:MerR family transcriptional regulator [Anaerolineales bacterium]
MGFLPPIPRSAAGYRLYTEYHIDQMRLARLALHAPYPGGKDPVLAAVNAAAAGNLGEALEHAYRYLVQVRSEFAQADAAVVLLERWASGMPADVTARPLRIGQAAALLKLSPDLLRHWERNQLIQAPRDPHSGYRIYHAKEIGRLRVIRMLRAAGYSMMAVLRLMRHLDTGSQGDLRAVLNTPDANEEITSAADAWFTTLRAQEERALAMIDQIEAMLRKYQR